MLSLEALSSYNIIYSFRRSFSAPLTPSSRGARFQRDFWRAARIFQTTRYPSAYAKTHHMEP